MLLARENGALKIYAETYSLEFVQDRPFVNLEDQSGSRIAELFVLSSIHPLNGRDDTTWIESWRVEESLSEIVCSLETSSSAWQSKTIRFRCQPRRFTYQVEVCGDGQISEANYFGGYYSGQIRWGCGFSCLGSISSRVSTPNPPALKFIPSRRRPVAR